MRIALLFCVIVAVPCVPAYAQPTELAIHETVLRKGDGPARPIFSFPVRIGATTIETGIDTGSIGLRVLPGTLKADDATSSSEPDTYGYGSGVKLEGRVGTARVSLGSLSGTSSLQLIDKVECYDRRPHCPAEQVGDQANYGLMGQGIPDAGFRAIAGIRLAPAEPNKLNNPLVDLGARRWIIDLPRRDESAGRVQIDPLPVAAGGFVDLPAASAAFGEEAPANTVPGCLVDLGGERRKICGSILFDTGSLGIAVTLPSGRIEDWPLGEKARLILGDGHGRALAKEDFQAAPVHYGRVVGMAPRPGLTRPLINVGVVPFLGFSVLYDADRHSIAVRPRPSSADGPRATTVADNSPEIPSGTQAAGTPEAGYKRQVGCSAILETAVERLHDPALQAKARDAIVLARRAAENSGAAIGKAVDMVHEDIATDQRGINQRFDAASASPDEVKAQEADLGKAAIACALVHAIEQTRHQ